MLLARFPRAADKGLPMTVIMVYLVVCYGLGVALVVWLQRQRDRFAQPPAKHE